MAEFQERPTKVRGSTSDRVFPRRGTVCLRLRLEDDSEGLILNLKNVYYLPNNHYNLVRLELLNNSCIFYNNKRKNLYKVISKRVLAQTKRWRNSYLLYPLNLTDGALHLLRVDDKTYQLYVFQSSTTSSFAPLSLFIWHKRLGYSNFSALKTYLICLNIKFDNNSNGYISNSCLQAKAIKMYHRDLQKCSDRPY